MKIGILGGGQLGRMLWEASCTLAKDLGPSPIFHPEPVCPASHAGATVVVGNVTETDKLKKFFASVDTFAIESEFLDVDAIESAWGTGRRQPAPSFAGLRIAQDKLEQKKFFVANMLPTSDFVEITARDLESEYKIATLHEQWQGLVLKKARMGYDGKGNRALPPGAPLDFASIRAFCESAFTVGSRMYAEKFVPFEKEVALVSCQSFAGDFGHYPLIETQQKKGVCFLAFTALNEMQNEKRAAEIARVIANKLNMLGTFAVEFFVTSKGELLVNEMAPRVHNSGHFSQRASVSNQFEMHLKAYYVREFDPKDFASSSAFAMVNFLGPEGLKGPVAKPKNGLIYWYDKEMTSPGRKLGHMITHSSDKTELPQMIEQLMAAELRWQESLRTHE